MIIIGSLIEMYIDFLVANAEIGLKITNGWLQVLWSMYVNDVNNTIVILTLKYVPYGRL